MKDKTVLRLPQVLLTAKLASECIGDVLRINDLVTRVQFYGNETCKRTNRSIFLKKSGFLGRSPKQREERGEGLRERGKPPP